MREKLNPEKSKKLRPLRVILAILIGILIVLVLDRLPTSVWSTSTGRHELLLFPRVFRHS